MRNIYDIISEQRLTTEVNIASYDLTYTIEHFEQNNYLQEGLGESIKNIAKKVIAFINSVINKIKDLVRKFINWITGKKDVVEKLNNEISQVNGESTTSNKDTGTQQLQTNRENIKSIQNTKNDTNSIKQQRKEEKRMFKEQKREDKYAAKDHKKEVKSEIKEAKKKRKDINEVLKANNSKIMLQSFAPLSSKMGLAKKFFNNISSVSNLLVGTNRINDNVLVNEVMLKTFTGAGRSNNDDGSTMSISKKIELELNEGKEIQSTISDNADKIIDYLSNGKEAVKYIQGQEKISTYNLNKLIRYVEQVGIGSDRGGETDINKRINLIKSASVIISEFVVAMCQSIVKSINISEKLAVRAKNDYVNYIKNMKKSI